jgi:hypothetical protein
LEFCVDKFVGDSGELLAVGCQWDSGVKVEGWRGGRRKEDREGKGVGVEWGKWKG